MGQSCITEIAQRWLAESEGILGRETVRLYGWHMEQYVLPRFGDAEDISEGEVRALLAELREAGLSDNTVMAVHRVIRRVLEYGASVGLCGQPQWKIALGTPRKAREVTILSPSQEAQLAGYLIENPTNKHLCLFLMLTTGIQIGEVLGLKWDDISVKKGEMRVCSERGPVTERKRVVRTVPIGERQKIYLRRMAGQDGTYISTGTSKTMGRANLENRFRNILKEQGLPPMSPSGLRHTYAVRSIEGGMDYETLSRLLGVDNGSSFRRLYRALVAPEQKERLERERFEGRKVRVPNKTRRPSPKDPAVEALERKIEQRKKELRDELDNLEGDLAIIRTLRNSDCVQGQAREGFYAFVEKVLGPDDKDGKYLVEYLRCNMRVADMPLRQVTTVQAIRRRVAHGFAKLSARLEVLEKAD